MVAVDIHDAYGSIIQDRLLDIVEEASKEALGVDYMNRVVHIDEIDWKTPLICRELSNNVYQINKHKAKIKTVSDLMYIIKATVKCQLISRRRRSYLIVRGLSQAMPLSAALCNLYIAHLGRTQLAQFTAEQNETMIRVVDDFLYITPNLSRAHRFLKVMSSGFKDYGIFINPSKTQHNLENNLEIHFFGYLINSDNQEVYVKYSQGEKAAYRNAVKFSNWKDPLVEMERRLKLTITFKLNCLTTDVNYMSIQGSMWNVFQTACVAACTLKAMLGSWRMCFDIDELLGLVHGNIENIAKRVRKLRFSDGIRLQETSWLVVRAYQLCMSYGSSDADNYLGELVLALEILEEQTRSAVRPKVFCILQELTECLPPQFTHNH